MSIVIKGIPASPGISVGKVYLYKENELFINTNEATNIEIEKDKLLNGRDLTKQQLLSIREKLLKILEKIKQLFLMDISLY